MKNQTLAVALGTATVIAATLMGTTNPASAVNTVMGPGSTGTGSIVRDPLEDPTYNTFTINQTFNRNPLTNPIDSSRYIDIHVDPSDDMGDPYVTANTTYNFILDRLRNQNGPWKTFVLEIVGTNASNVTFTSAGGFSAVGGGGSGWAGTIETGNKKVVYKSSPPPTLFNNPGSAIVTFAVMTNASFPTTGDRSFKIRQYATPEPLTILGTGVVLGAIPALKKEYAKRAKKKSENA